MNILRNFYQKEKTMTSKEIAELTGKTHSNIMVDIRKIVQQLENKRELKFQLSYYEAETGNGTVRKYEMYILTQEETLLLISGYNVNLRSAIIKRWKELETQNQFKVPQNFRDALLLAADQQLVIEQQASQIEVMKPKELFFDQVTGSKDAFDMADVAKVCNLGIGRNKLFEFLRENKALMSSNLPYQTHVDSGYFRVIESKYSKPDGSTHISLKTVVYQKGIDYIIKLYKSKTNE